MTEWREQKLSDFMDFNPYTPLSKGIIAKKVTMEKLIPFNRKIQGYEDAVFSGGAKFKNGDTLVARITPCLENGKTAYVDFLDDEEVAFGSTEFIVLRAKEGISDSRFIFYFAISDEFRDTAIQLMSGTSGRQRVDTEALKRKVFTLPPLPEQKAIAEVLSSLDDKIDLLTRQNKTLEDLAQAYFRKWFIEDASDEWEVGKLGDYIEIHDSKRVPLSKIEREKMKSGTLYPYYGAATIMDYVNDYIFDGEYILMGEDGTVETEDGYPVLQYATGKFWVNNHAHVLTAKSPFNNYFIWFFLKQCNISGIVTGAVQPKINQENLKNIDIPIPDLTLINSANQFFANIFAKILNNLEQIKTFQKLRDTLLPKLISGEIRLKM